MKKAVAIIAVVLLSALAVVAAPNAERDLHATIAAYREALVKKDVAALEQIWSDDYTFINAHGELHTKADRLADLKSGHTSLETITTEGEPVVHVHGRTVIVTSVVTIAGKYSGKEVSGRFRSMHVWIDESGQWRLVANQLTPIAK